jgi:bidirectional [NiFe] hydrogenase diaphorase subunit
LQTAPKVPEAPHPEDKRWAIVGATMRRHGYSPDALIETLHTVQNAFGFLDKEALAYVAKALDIPPSRVFGVATFYNFFTLKPQSEHSCVVCLGTACFIKGSPEILSSLQAHTGLKPGKTTPDNKVSLGIARCLGTCGLAPAAVYDGEVVGMLSPENAVARIEEWTKS